MSHRSRARTLPLLTYLSFLLVEQARYIRIDVVLSDVLSVSREILEAHHRRTRVDEVSICRGTVSLCEERHSADDKGRRVVCESFTSAENLLLKLLNLFGLHLE